MCKNACIFRPVSVHSHGLANFAGGGKLAEKGMKLADCTACF